MFQFNKDYEDQYKDEYDAEIVSAKDNNDKLIDHKINLLSGKLLKGLMHTPLGKKHSKIKKVQSIVN